jgi:hypothetical protein
MENEKEFFDISSGLISNGKNKTNNLINTIN